MLASMENDLEKFNILWSAKSNHTFTQEELDREFEKNPNFYSSYSLQEKLSKKYN
jgi:hypothetical protein